MDIKQALADAASELASVNNELISLKVKSKQLTRKCNKLKRALDAQDKLIKSLG